jgi:exodeoxyribonuclease VII large subunit
MDLFSSAQSSVPPSDQNAAEVFSISELNQFIKDVINAGFPQVVWITGEIQGYNRNKDKRHVFFELVEKKKNSQDIVARIGLVIFGNRKQFIQNILARSENAFSLKDDIEVKLACRVDFYAPHGAMRLVVESIDPVYTLGKLAQERQKLIAKLKKEGVLEKNKQLSLPRVPLKIGLITSDDSAAYNDFLNELQKSGLGFQLYLRNTLMQGSGAPKDVCQAMDELQRLNVCDCIVITRGGGSLADLSCFDSELIARKIATSKLPVLTGIGHEINTTIADLAAFSSAKTPTAIARFLIEAISSFVDELDESLERIFDLAKHIVDDQKQRLKSAANILQRSTTLFFQDHRERLVRYQETLKARPLTSLTNRKRDAGDLLENLKRILDYRWQTEAQRLESFKKIISILHPRNTLRRGFSIARDVDGKAIRSIKGLKKEDAIFTEVVDGRICSSVTEVSTDSENI